jgi:hypothetical protein
LTFHFVGSKTFLRYGIRCAQPTQDAFLSRFRMLSSPDRREWAYRSGEIGKCQQNLGIFIIDGVPQIREGEALSPTATAREGEALSPNVIPETSRKMIGIHF